MQQTTHEVTTPAWQLGLVWVLVLIPLGWGLAQTLGKAAPLFF
jgi:hypothetical protein